MFIYVRVERERDEGRERSNMETASKHSLEVHLYQLDDTA